MSKHTFSVLTSDIKKNPAILCGLAQEIAARTGYQGEVTTTEHDGVTTVTAVAA